MSFISWDIEIVKQLPESVDNDWQSHRPLGISCAAAASRVKGSTVPLVAQWSGYPGMNLERKQEMAYWLGDRVKAGHKIVTFNGLGFDFDILAEETGLDALCSTIAMQHIDIMFMIVCSAGHYLALDTASRGMGLEGKTSGVTLSDGSVLTSMSGKQAPILWAQKEFDAVLTYLNGDASQTLELAEAIERERCIRWVSQMGKSQLIDFPDGLLTVEQCLQLDHPDTSWMSSPPTREQFTEWVYSEQGLAKEN